MYVRKMKRKLTLLKKISEMMAEKPKDMLIKSADFPISYMLVYRMIFRK